MSQYEEQGHLVGSPLHWHLQAPVLATQSDSLLFIGGRKNDTHVVTLEILAPYSGSNQACFRVELWSHNLQRNLSEWKAFVSVG